MTYQDGFHDELLSGYLDGELTAAEQGLVEQALAENAELRHTYEELRALRGTLQSLPRYSLGEDFTQRVVRCVERESASVADQTATVITPARRENRWGNWVWVGGAGVAALVMIGLVALAQNHGPQVAVSPAPATVSPESAVVPPQPAAVSTARPADVANTAPAKMVELNPPQPENSAARISTPLVNIGESNSVPLTAAPSAAIASVRETKATAPAETHAPPTVRAASEMLVLEIDATPEANRTLALAAALAVSKIRLESPLRVGASGAEGEDVEHVVPSAAPKSSGPPKVEYFVIEGEREHVEALVKALRGKQQAFSRVAEPTTLADAIEHLSALDAATFGEPLPEPNLSPGSTVGIGSSKAIGANVKAEAAHVSEAPGNAGNTVASTPAAKPAQARAYRIDSPAALLSGEKAGDASSAHSVRVLLIVQNNGVAVEGALK